MKLPSYGSWQEKRGEIESEDLSGDLIVQLGAVTEDLNRRATLVVLERALELAGVEFIDENGGGPGVRLRKGTRKTA